MSNHDADDDDDVMMFADLGDAKMETKQRSPVPPYYEDTTFGMGDRPNHLY
jgi:hypothetical protein